MTDLASVRELVLFADNNYKLYQVKKTYWTNALNKVRKGTFDPKKAPKLFQYFADRASAEYKKEYGYAFPVAVRVAASKEFAAEFIEMVKSGEIS